MAKYVGYPCIPPLYQLAPQRCSKFFYLNIRRVQRPLRTQGAEHVAMNINPTLPSPSPPPQWGGIQSINQEQVRTRCALSNELVSQECERSHSGQNVSGAARAGPFDTDEDENELADQIVVDHLWAIRSQTDWLGLAVDCKSKALN